MKGLSQRKVGERKKVNLLQEYHEQKRIEDQRIQLRKIFIWAFIFCCIYFVWNRSADRQDIHYAQIKTEQAQTQVNQVGHQSVQDDSINTNKLSTSQNQKIIEQQHKQQYETSELLKHQLENHHENQQQDIQNEKLIQDQQGHTQDTYDPQEIPKDSNTQNLPEETPSQEI